MMLDIFSSFDPAINSLNSMSNLMFWTMIILSTVMFMSSLWVTPNNIFILKSSVMSVMNDQSNRTSGAHLKGFNIMMVALFILIMNVNLIGLLPAVFSYSSHLLFSLSFGLPLWLSMIISAIMFNVSSWAASLLPGGAPHWLNPFLVLIETISISVRPLTLSFRLAANMSAGHIVLTLIGTYCANAMVSSIIGFIILILVQLGYIMFELGICMIQSYIFCLLLSLYADDHP